MTILKAALICITVNGAFGNLYMCTINAHRIHINIACNKNERIRIANTWALQLDKNYSYCDDMKMKYTEARFGKKYGVKNHMIHEITTKCSGQRSCRVSHYTDYVMPGERAPRDTQVIVIKYECISAVDFIPFCEDMSTKRLYTLPIFLIHHYKGITTQDTCNCDVTYRGNFGVSLTLFPTESEYLKTTTWTRGSISRQHFKDRVYKNEVIVRYPEKETFTVVNSKTKSKDENAFILVRIAAYDANSFFKLQCFGPIADIHGRSQTTRRSEKAVAPSAPVTLYAVISSVSVTFLLGIGIGVFVLHRRYAGKRKQCIVKMSCGTDTDHPDGATVETRKLHSTFYNDSIGSCSHSYADIGSAAFGYIHCVMPDHISHQNVSVPMHYDTADDDNYQTQEQGPSNDVVPDSSTYITIYAEVINDHNNST